MCTSKWYKRERTRAIYVRQKSIRGLQKRKRRLWKQRRAYLLGFNGVGRAQPAQTPPKQQLLARTSSGPETSVRETEQKPVGFFSAEPGNPAHLVRRLLMAGDIETNPGPEVCTCGKRVSGSSIRCTWCSRWIHQRCSGMSRKELTKMSRDNRYAFECTTCLKERQDTGSPPPGDRVEPDSPPQETPPEDVSVDTGTPQKEDTRSPPPGDKVEPDSPQQETPTPQNEEANSKTRRGKWRRRTEEMNQKRNERRKQKREEKKQKPTRMKKNKKETNKKETNKLQVVTWNLQGISTRERNRDRLRRAIQHAKQQGWEVVLVSEMRSEQDGVIWMGEDDEQAVVVHSERSGVILQGEALKEWIEGKQQKSFSERVTTVQIGNIRLVSVYQPLWSNGEEGIEKFRRDLENELARTPKDVTLIIGGDFNSHVGRLSQRDGVSGKYGLSTRTGEAGTSLLEWCEENNLQHVNSYYHMRSRGTWFNQMHRRWYELDGFVMRPEQRHRLVKKIRVVQEMTLSDHKPVAMTISREKKRRHRVEKRQPAINWEKLKQEETAESFKTRTWELIQECQQMNWDDIAKVLTQAATETCGLQKRQAANPWTIGHEDELKQLHTRISTLVLRRNDLMGRRRTRSTSTDADGELEETKGLLRTERKMMKRKLRQLEKEWWDKIIDECVTASERGDLSTLYSALRKLGTRSSKPQTGTTLTTDEFQKHFQSVSNERFETEPGDLMRAVSEMGDHRHEEAHKEANEKMNKEPTVTEVREAMKEVKDSAPGKDGVRMRYIRGACSEVEESVVELVIWMFNERADKWEESLKCGQIIPLHKKGSRNDTNNYRGVCLLPMASRILARVLSKRLRWWSEEFRLLDENQSGFRPGRSTADASQIIMRIQEDVTDLVKRRRRVNEPSDNKDPEARLLDLTKAYPRVNKPALWEVLRRYGLEGPFLESLMDLHESTTYCIKGREGNSDEWQPERGLREGCPSSPGLFNIYHQVVMRAAERAREETAKENNRTVGVRWRWLSGSKLPNPDTVDKYNSEATTVIFSLSLFADDTTPIGDAEELEDGVTAMKRVMETFEEKNNESKEEKLKFGTEESGETRMLGVWCGPKEDLKNRKKRAGGLWAKVKARLKKTKITKKKQAKVVEMCVESGLLFDAAVRPWYVADMKNLQSWVDKCYRYIWSNKRQPPLIEMEERGKNMQDVRNDLQVKSLRWKIEKRTLQRIGHILRMSNDRPTKAAVLGWLEKLEGRPKCPGKKRKTLLYWKKILKEAGIEWTTADELAADRKIWRAKVHKRMEHLERWERCHGHFSMDDAGPRNAALPEMSTTCTQCDKVCKSKAGLRIHEKRMHEEQQIQFECKKCNTTFKTENTMKNHTKTCDGGVNTRLGFKWCENCRKEISKTNFARHRRSCAREEVQQEMEETEARKYRSKTKICSNCGIPQAATNMARHKRTCVIHNSRGEGVPFDPGVRT